MVGVAAAMLFENAHLPDRSRFLPHAPGERSTDAPSLVVKPKTEEPRPFFTTNTVTVSEAELAQYSSPSVPRSFAGAAPDSLAFNFVTPAAPSVSSLANAVTSGAASPREKAERLLSWVRVNIASDPSATNINFSRYPAETLAAQRGGAHDASFLYLSLCKAAGVDGVLLNFSNKMSTAVHLPDPAGAAVSFRGKTFTVADPSAALSGPGGSSTALGSLPQCYEGQSTVVYGPHIDAVITGIDVKGIAWQFTIPASRIQEQRSKPGKRGFFKENDPSQASFVTPNDPIIKTIAETLTREATTDREKANCLLHFVRSNIKYDFAETAPNTDYFRLPLETIADRTGDCEDKSILFSSLTRAAGMGSALVRLPGHMASAVVITSGDAAGSGYRIGDTFYSFVETTGADIATVPHRIQRDSETGLAIGNPGSFTSTTANVIVIP